jgi:hypothetical protein
MTLLANRQQTGTEDVELIWRGIVDYANEDSTHSDFKELIIQSFRYMGIEDADKALRKCSDLQDGSSLKELEDGYRKQIRNILLWIIGPSNFGPTEVDPAVKAMSFATDASRFLTEEAANIHFKLHPGMQLDPESGELTVFLHRVLIEIPSVVAGVCHFILQQIDRHDLRGEPLTHVFRFGLCDRNGCGRLFMVRRVGRGRFCSDNCRSAVGKQKMTKAEKAAYMKQYRSAKVLETSRAERAARRAKRNGVTTTTGKTHKRNR